MDLREESAREYQLIPTWLDQRFDITSSIYLHCISYESSVRRTVYGGLQYMQHTHSIVRWMKRKWIFLPRVPLQDTGWSINIQFGTFSTDKRLMRSALERMLHDHLKCKSWRVVLLFPVGTKENSGSGQRQSYNETALRFKLPQPMISIV